MALFTVKPATVQKDVAATFTIDYAELASYSAVPAGYYKNTSNWKKVFARMKHKYSNQKATLDFELPGTSADLLLTDAARAGDWELDHILIRDFDRGEVVLKRSDIPNVVDIDFIAKSAATHGDVYVPAGEELVISSGGKKQYGDFIVEAGGTVRLSDGGGITEFEILGTCLINGTILANNGKHSGGSWSSNSVLGETLFHDVQQKTGGYGGAGEAGAEVTTREPTSGDLFDMNNPTAVQENDTAGTTNFFWNGTFRGSLPGSTGHTSFDGTEPGAVDETDGNTTYYKGALEQDDGNLRFYRIHREVVSEPAGGIGGEPSLGLFTFGNGGGGGRSAQFGALDGGDAQGSLAGLGAGQDDPAADEFGEDGADSLTASEAGSGGFRGAHGQALYLKARKIQGSGTIDAAGQKGGDGGDGAEYNSGGILYGNGAGGGGAGGEGGNVWLRYKAGTPSLVINVAGGAKGSRGVGGFGSTEAEHGVAGSNGISHISTFS